MEMESSRRPFDRSREPGLKKARLNDEPERNPSLGRPFGSAAAAQRPIAGSPMVPRFRAAEREPESNDSGRGGGGYQPQPLPAAQQHQELVSQYREALAELTFNSKPIITNLTIIAGENLQAAKAIAGTVCANIIEVPSEQKLPSLYLLDSIVKNIGREYIKNFASKLPEVFCKAYRQVDAPIHQSMRHLFGTWKGVFPAQTLQMIEKELGFATAANGSSTGAATSRPDSQSNRPLQNSIHVNPKYLERQQRLQQPTRAKGLPSDLSGSIPNSIEDAESMDRATSVSSGRGWVDPSARAHNMQRSNRGGESIHEKNIGAEYADFDYASNFSRNSGLGIERGGDRIAEQGQERNLYGGAGSLAESLSGQRNSFNVKHGFPNYSAPKSTSANVHPHSAKNMANRSSGGISSDSWKNSDEEEFRWSDMNSKLADHGMSDTSSNFRKDRSASEDSDKSGLEDHIHKPQGLHDYGTRTDKFSAEQKDLGPLRHRSSSPWLSQESHPIDGRSHSGTSSFGFPENAVSGSSGALPQQRFQSLKSGPPPSLRQGPPSPTLTARHPHLQLHGSTELDRAKTQPLSHPGSRVSQFSGHRNIGVHNSYSQDSVPMPPSHAQLGKMAKSLSNDIHASSSIPAFQRHQYPFGQQVEDHTDSELLSQIQKPSPPEISNSGAPSTLGGYTPDRLSGLPVEALGDLNPSSQLAALMKSGILSNTSITTGSLANQNARISGQLSSKKGQSLVPDKTTPKKFVNPESKVAPASSVSQSASFKISQKKVPSGPPPPSSPLNSASENALKDAKTTSDPISNLLSSLVAKGLISASKTETPSASASPQVAPTETQRKSPSATSTTSSLPVSSARDDDTAVSEPAHVSPAALPKSTKLEIKNLLGFNFKQNLIRELHPTVISDLLDGYEHCCTICGLRLKLQEQLDRHLEWHEIKKAESSGSTKPSRKWYPRDWISEKGFDSAESEDEPESATEEDEPMVPAEESQCVCVLCGEIFKDFYCQEKDEWMFKGAVHMMIPSRAGADGEIVREGPIVHANCVSESSLQDLGLVSQIKMEKDV